MPEPAGRCAVVIPTLDRRDLLIQCVESLRTFAGSCRDQVVVVDAGHDGSAAWAEANNCLVLKYPGATFAEAANAGVEATRRPVIVLANNDLIFTSDAVGELNQALRASGRCLVGARLLSPSGLVQHAGIGLDTEGNPYQLWRGAPAETPEVMQSGYPLGVTFALVACWRHLWDEVGRLDTDFLNSYEDLDFCLRARERGILSRYWPSATAIHLEGQSPGRPDRVAESWAHFRTKWLDSGRLWPAIGCWPFQLERREG